MWTQDRQSNKDSLKQRMKDTSDWREGEAERERGWGKGGGGRGDEVGDEEEQSLEWDCTNTKFCWSCWYRISLIIEISDIDYEYEVNHFNIYFCQNVPFWNMYPSLHCKYMFLVLTVIKMMLSGWLLNSTNVLQKDVSRWYC